VTTKKKTKITDTKKRL